MINTMRAYLHTEDNVDYRNCKIAYYTYAMFETPNKFKINVNVHIQSPKIQVKKTLNTDNSFDNENDAITYGIAEGKKYIDDSYEAGKISFITTEEKPRRSFTQPNNSTFASPTKSQSQRKGK
ncbi:MAG TPA: hypothetical protein VLG38_04880 [Gammaproteobacteria bacterium]|nr:hypothetical protein [Gammaproteobacteria bacterium]